MNFVLGEGRACDAIDSKVLMFLQSSGKFKMKSHTGFNIPHAVFENEFHPSIHPDQWQN